MRPSLADLRREYTRAGLQESDADADPFVQFQRWFDQAVEAQVPEPNAMIVATATREGKPSARTMLLKAMNAQGLTFFTNYGSRKARELEENPHAALLFLWIELERQVRVTGRVERVSRAESEVYFHSRPRGSQLGAWASRQSTVIGGRELLEREMADLEKRYGEGRVPLPPHWGGYRVAPEEFEFWQGRTNRLHDRLRYVRQAEGGWKRERLAP